MELQTVSTFDPETKFIAVANTGPLVSIFQCRRIILLEIYFEQIHIPISIVQELEKHNANELLDRLISRGIVIIRHLTEMEKSEASRIAIEIATSPLAKDKDSISHLAEAEAIVLMQRLLPIANYILLDELAAREIAEQRGLPVTGFAGILIMACRDKLISPEQVRRLLLICQSQGSHYSNRFIEGVYQRLLHGGKIMKKLSKIKKIEPHEPKEQLVDVDAAFRDADRMMLDRKRIKQERLKAKRELEELGMVVLNHNRS